MRSLYLRIWLTVVAALALFALVSGWLVQRHLEQERDRFESSMQDRLTHWAVLLQRSLPEANEPAALQARALEEWSQKLRLPMALDAADGSRIATSQAFRRREDDSPSAVRLSAAVRLSDGRLLWMMRPRLPVHLRGGPMGRMEDGRGKPASPGVARGGGLLNGPLSGPLSGPLDVPGLPDGVVLLALLALLFAAVAAGAWPVVRRLTRRLEALKQGVEAFGGGALDQRVAVDGRDEVAQVARSFNEAATRIEALMRSHQSLLANASHELRSPLARLKMALTMLDETPPEQRAGLQTEIAANIAELDALVEEVLLASRLDGQRSGPAHEPVDLLGLLAEEAARVGAEVQGPPATVLGDERLLRRALRNLLENARRYGGPGASGGEGIQADIRRGAAGSWQVNVCDRGPGVPEAQRERIFEAFFRLPGHAEREGGVGLGLSLVRQIAQHHGGQVQCLPRDGGGSCFRLTLPAAA